MDPRSLHEDDNKMRSEEHTSELQSPCNLVCRLLLEKKKNYCSWITRSSDPLGGGGGAQPLATRRRACPTRVWIECSGSRLSCIFTLFFFFNDTATTEIYPFSLPDALPIYLHIQSAVALLVAPVGIQPPQETVLLRAIRSEEHTSELQSPCNLVCRLLL